MIDGILVTPQRIIPTPGGDVLHAMKQGEPGAKPVGEAYFSTVEHRAVKAWKRHRLMTLNLVVPVGEIRFVIFDDRPDSPTKGNFEEIALSPRSYARLTVPPGVWMGFQGIGMGKSILLNLADMVHDPGEVDRVAPDIIRFEWREPE